MLATVHAVFEQREGQTDVCLCFFFSRVVAPSVHSAKRKRGHRFPEVVIQRDAGGA
jgi:hypothetical protein